MIISEILYVFSSFHHVRLLPIINTIPTIAYASSIWLCARIHRVNFFR